MNRIRKPLSLFMAMLLFILSFTSNVSAMTVSDPNHTSAGADSAEPSDQTAYFSWKILTWSYQDDKDRTVDASIDEHNTISLTEAFPAKEAISMRFQMEYEQDEAAKNISSGDYITLAFPNYMKNVTVEEDGTEQLSLDISVETVSANAPNDKAQAKEKDLADVTKAKLTFSENVRDRAKGRLNVSFEMDQTAVSRADADGCLPYSISSLENDENGYKLSVAGKEQPKAEPTPKTAAVAPTKMPTPTAKPATTPTVTPTKKPAKRESRKAPWSTGGDSEEAEEPAPAANLPATVTATITLNYDCTFNGINWQDVVKPLVLDTDNTKLKIVATLSDGSTKEFYGVSTPQAEFSTEVTLKDGGGDFYVLNMPTTIDQKQVKSFTFSIERSNNQYTFFGGSLQVTLEENKTAYVGTLTESLQVGKMHPVTLEAEVVPNSPSGLTFSVTGHYSYAGQENKTKPHVLQTGTDEADKPNQTVIQVPEGVQVYYTADNSPGYEFQKYELKETENAAVKTETDRARGISITSSAEQAPHEKITYLNQNNSCEFSVEWFDNNNSNGNRPDVTAEHFPLEYSTDEGKTWTKLTNENCSAIGLSSAPTLNEQQSIRGIYSYDGLPAMTKGDAPKTLQYRVEPLKDKNYMVKTEGSQKFKYTYIRDFAATIQWLDNDGQNQDDDGNPINRPTIAEYKEGLKLYRYIKGDDYELIDDAEIKVTEGTASNQWSVSAEKLPRYNENNEEYAYVLVKGSIETAGTSIGTVTQDTPQNYRAYYDNGSGSHGNTIDRCYDQGTIKNLIEVPTKFNVTKVWLDDGSQETIDKRPEATVTLWRFSTTNKTGDGIALNDTNFSKATPVVYHPDKSSSGSAGHSVLLAVKINGTDYDNIDFTKVEGLPENYQLPKYDENGNLYVYFVREAVEDKVSSAEGAADANYYEPSYYDKEQALNEYGAGNNGTIKNRRREKAEIQVTKIWAAPEQMNDINGSSIRVGIQVTAADGNKKVLELLPEEEKDFRALTEDALKEASTIRGFVPSIPSQTISFYVDRYDENGQPYHFDTNATVFEYEVIDENGTSIVINENGNGELKDEFNFKEHSYRITSRYVADGSDAEKKKFAYTVQNTIYGIKDFTVTKDWSGVKKSYEDVDSVIYEVNATSENPETSYKKIYKVIGSIGEDQATTVSGQKLLLPKSAKKSDDAKKWSEQISGKRTEANNYKFEWQAYDDDGYPISYKAKEVGYMANGKEESFAGRWSVWYEYLDDETIMHNYDTGGPVSWIRLEKKWLDGEDVSMRKPILIRGYQKSDFVNIQSAEELTTLLNDSEKAVFEKKLSARNLWYQEFTIDKNPKNLVVLEYAIEGAKEDGQNAVIDYSRYLAKLKALASDPQTETITTGDLLTQTKITSDELQITTKDRRYAVTSESHKNGDDLTANTSDYSYTFINRRIGNVNLKIQKTWKDGEATERPDLKFRITRNNQPLSEEDLKADEKLKAALQDIISYQQDPSDATKQISVITISSSTKNLVKDGSSKWIYTIADLPKFDQEGKQYTYFLEEIPMDEKEEYKPGKSDVRHYPLENEIDHDEVAFSYLNRKDAKMDVIVHIKWKDAAVNPANRPDAKLVLQRYVKKSGEVANNETVTDGADQVWTKINNNPTYDWTVTVRDLPKYDEEGYEYVYYFEEVLNNGGKTAEGQYQVHVDPLEEDTHPVGPEDEEEKHPALNDETIINTITADMTYSGIKTWVGVTVNNALEDLPSPVIVLKRSINNGTKEIVASLQLSDNKYRFEFPKDINMGAAFTDFLKNQQSLSDLTYVGNISTYRMTDQSQINAYKKSLVNEKFLETTERLPKFDEDGNRYQYEIQEIFENEVQGFLYSYEPSGLLINRFDNTKNVRSIPIRKKWHREGIAEKEDVYPTVVFQLYRYLQGIEPNFQGTPYKTITVGGNKWKSKGVGADGWVDAGTFDSLPIYSYKGELYQYAVREVGLNGSSINGYAPVTYYDEGKTEKSDTGAIHITSKPSLTNPTESELSSVGRLENTYTNEDKVHIRGNKNWNDYGGNTEYGKRPEGIDVRISRSVNAERDESTNYENGFSNNDIYLSTLETDCGNGNAMLLTETDAVDANKTQPYIVWESKGTDTWRYTVYNLDRYAPNGQPYVYSIEEAGLERQHYKKSASVKPTTNVPSVDGIVSMASMVNEYGGSYTVRKNWHDGNNKYNLRPTSVTIYLQWSKDGGLTFENVPWNQATAHGQNLPSVATVNGEKIVSVTLEAKDVVPNTRGNSWTYTFKNLPLKIEENGQTVNLQYRGVEVKIGNLKVKEETTGGKTEEKAGAYTVTSRITNSTNTEADLAGTTEINNRLQSTTLQVEKTWKNDSNDDYESRPDTVTFYLERNSAVSVEEAKSSDAKWERVENEDGTDFEFTLSAKNDWKTTLTDLPIVDGLNSTDQTLKYLYFRAVEKTSTLPSEQGKKVADSAKSYADITLYTSTSDTTRAAWDYEQTKGNTMKVTNDLIKSDTETITAKKKWINADDSVPADVTFVLQSRPKNAAESVAWKSYDKIMKSVKATEYNSNHDASVSWSNMPKYDLQGNELEYRIIERKVGDQDVPENGIYKINGTKYKSVVTEDQTSTPANPSYTIANIEMQEYEVQKIWDAESYAAKKGNQYEATFELQQSIEDEKNTDGTLKWTQVAKQDAKTLSTKSMDKQDALIATWSNLPKYTPEGKKITYRAVETAINGTTIKNPKCDGTDTDGNYISSYQYGENKNATQPQFGNQATTVTNRMIYGFVNLRKVGGYLDATNSSIQPSGTEVLVPKNVTFDIYKGNEVYVHGVHVNAEGFLETKDGKYGTEEKYLVAGTYRLVEVTAGDGFSKWSQGVGFTIGSNGGATDTGDRGTAWITASETISNKTSLKYEVTYIAGERGVTSAPKTKDGYAYNLESRGTLEFTKKGPNDENLIGHSDSDSKAYFGVYTDAACTQQVAGMIQQDSSSKVILTNQVLNGTGTIPEKLKNKIPYSRTIGSSTYLLSGTYYIKELRPPAGYKMDDSVHKANIQQFAAQPESSYATNRGTIENLTKSEWPNELNEIKIYKMDQYGRNVELDKNAHLELKKEDEGEIVSRQTSIKLYPNASKNDQFVTYNAGEHSWTVKGVFDGNSTTEYVLSEPENSVPNKNLQANAITFTVDEKGKLKTITGTTVAKRTNPTFANGITYQSYYDDSTIVFRDVARYVTKVGLTKTRKDTAAPIQHISFELYRCAGDIAVKSDEDQSVLGKDVYLTTDADGKIDLSTLDTNVINQVTKKPLAYGLDIGTYYFVEVERGAADQYRLGDPIFFKIEPNDMKISTAVTKQDADGAKFTKESGWKDGTEPIVENTPVEDESIKRTLKVKKTGTDGTSLNGAEFKLTYQSVTANQAGSKGSSTQTATTNGDGEIRIDISNKGTYTLTETKAADRYQTVTDANGETKILLSFVVSDTDIQVTEKEGWNGTLDNYTIDTNQRNLTVTIKNRPTKISIDKMIKDHDRKLSGAELQIIKAEAPATAVESWTSNGNVHEVTGKLVENTLYILRETKAPTGFRKADDIYFYLWGTTAKNSGVSQLFVWKGEGTPTTIGGTGWKKVDDAHINMYDQSIYAPVNLKKVLVENGEQKLLAGAVFKITSGDTALGTAITGGDGQLTWNEIMAAGYQSGLIYDSSGQIVTSNYNGQRIFLREASDGYTLTETDAPKQVHYDKSISFNVTEADYIAYRNNATVKWLKDPGKEKVENQPFEAKFKLFKYDPKAKEYSDENKAGGKLANVVFELTDPDGDKTYPKTGADGVLSIDLKKRGEYFLVEKTPLAGYVNPLTTAITFIVDNDDYKKTLTYDASGADNRRNTKVVSETGSDDVSVTDLYGIENERKAGSLELEKVDAKTNEKLSGVEFKLDVVDENGNVTNNYAEFRQKTYTTGSDGKLKIENLPWGTYKLTETKADGYKLLPNPITFTIDGTHLNEDRTGGKAVKNERTHLKLEKRSKDGKSLNNAKFKLYPVTTAEGAMTMQAATKEFYYEPTATTKSTTDVIEVTGGSINLYGLVAGSYVLREEQAPFGYEKSGDILIRLDANGVVTASKCTVNGTQVTEVTEAGAADYFEVDSTKETVTVKDEPIEVKIQKYDKEDANKTKALSGAVYRIYGEAFADNNGNKVNEANANLVIQKDQTLNRLYIEVKQDQFTEKLKGRLIANEEYQIEEITAPNGYEIAPKAVKFKVDEYGIIQVLSDNGTVLENNSYSFTDNDTSLSASNDVFELTDRKIEIDLEKQQPNSDGWEALSTDIQEKLGYATFTVSGTFAAADGSGTESNDTSITELSMKIDTSNGKSIFRNELRGRLIGGKTYTISETSVPKGMTKMADVTFTIDKKGHITKVGSETFTDERTTLPLKNEWTKVGFQKTDANGKPIQKEATFELTGKFADAASDERIIPRDANSNTEATLTFTTGEINPTWIEKQLIVSLPDKEQYVYTLKEITPPDGYKISDEHGISFKLNADGTIVGVNGAVISNDGTIVGNRSDTASGAAIPSGVYKVDNQTNQIKLTTRDEKISLKLLKKDAKTGTALAGAQFKVEGTFTASGVNGQRTANDTKVITVDEQGLMTETVNNKSESMDGKWIAGQSYVFTETKAPDGYELYPNFGAVNKSVEFKVTVKNDGTFKTKADGSLEFVTDSNGQEIVTKLVAKSGDASGSTQSGGAVGKSHDEDAEIDGTDRSQIVVWNNPIEIYIEKVNDDKSIKLAGAEFTLSDLGVVTAGTNPDNNAGEVIAEKITTVGINGQVMISEDKLKAGKKLTYNHRYKLTETKAPDGYECTAEVFFTIAENGTITDVRKINKTVGAAAINRDGQATGELDTIQVQDKLTKQITLKKVDESDPTTVLENVEFEIEPAAGSSFSTNFNVPSTLSGGIERYVTATDSNGKVSITAVIGKTTNAGTISIPTGLFNHSQSYILTETKGPGASYQFAKDEKNRQITFEVTKDGQYRIAAGKGNPLYAFNSPNQESGIVLTVKNVPIVVEIAKKDLDAGLLAGAKLKLSKKDETGFTPITASDQVTSAGEAAIDADGSWMTTAQSIKFKAAVGEQYRLEEVQAPDGYNSISDPLYFKIDANGLIVLTDQNGAELEQSAFASETIPSNDAERPNGTRLKPNGTNFVISNPKDGNAGTVRVDVMNAQFVDLAIEKQDASDSNTKLAGVQFVLRAKVDDTYKYVVTDDADVTKPSKSVQLNNATTESKAQTLRTAAGDDAAAAATVTTGTDGVATFKNLPNGTYQLTEIKTAGGYQLLSKPLTVIIDRSNSTEPICFSGDDESNRSAVIETQLTKRQGDNHPVLRVIVKNRKGFTLPATGITVPRLPVYLLMGVGLLEAIALFWYSRKKKKGGLQTHSS